ncbi:MAG: hypothetical protein ACU826_04620 [Gammaproteobacteria bacterium]
MNSFPEIGRIVIIGLSIVIPLFVIYKKAGFHPAWALLVFLPGFGLLLIFLQLAFMPWPNQKDRVN